MKKHEREKIGNWQGGTGRTNPGPAFDADGSVRKSPLLVGPWRETKDGLQARGIANPGPKANEEEEMLL